MHAIDASAYKHSQTNIHASQVAPARFSTAADAGRSAVDAISNSQLSKLLATLTDFDPAGRGFDNDEIQGSFVSSLLRLVHYYVGSLDGKWVQWVGQPVSVQHQGLVRRHMLKVCVQSLQLPAQQFLLCEDRPMRH